MKGTQSSRSHRTTTGPSRPRWAREFELLIPGCELVDDQHPASGLTRLVRVERDGSRCRPGRVETRIRSDSGSRLTCNLKLIVASARVLDRARRGFVDDKQRVLPSLLLELVFGEELRERPPNLRQPRRLRPNVEVQPATNLASTDHANLQEKRAGQRLNDSSSRGGYGLECPRRLVPRRRRLRRRV